MTRARIALADSRTTVADASALVASLARFAEAQRVERLVDEGVRGQPRALSLLREELVNVEFLTNGSDHGPFSKLSRIRPIVHREW